MELEQKISARMKVVVEKSTKPGNLVVHDCAETVPVLKACMLLPNHRRLIGYEVDPGCATEEMQLLVDLYARYVLSTKSETDG